MTQEPDLSRPEGEDGFEPLADGDESLEALGGTGIELIHGSVTPLTADM
jgi:hypothetical protein